MLTNIVTIEPYCKVLQEELFDGLVINFHSICKWAKNISGIMMKNLLISLQTI